MRRLYKRTKPILRFPRLNFIMKIKPNLKLTFAGEMHRMK